MELSEIGVFVGVDMAKTDRCAQATTTDGVEVFVRAVLNDQTAIEKLIDDASSHGGVAIVIDMTASNAQLLLAVAAEHQVPVADANRIINRTRDALTALSPGLERVVGQRFVQAGVRDLITKWSTPTALRDVGKTKIGNTIKKRSPRIAAKIGDEIWAALDAQTVVLPAEETWGQVVGELLADLDRIQTQRGRLATQIEGRSFRTLSARSW
jgi:hypothetical protein|tara:strand:+ start:741 stop:1373 length:633 start_codon:yes stop_codon:yes gene_type:complete